MSKQPTRTALAFKALVEFSDSVPAEDTGGASAILARAFNAQSEPSKVDSGQFSPGSSKAVMANDRS